MQTIEQELPIELECWLLRHGILECDKAPELEELASLYTGEEESHIEPNQPI